MATPLLELRNVTKVFQSGIRKTAASTTIALRDASLIVPSALAGALLVLVADCLCRVLPLVTELRLGIALSLVGAPFFLWLLLRMRREVLQ